jgi:hypothetical protein
MLNIGVTWSRKNSVLFSTIKDLFNGSCIGLDSEPRDLTSFWRSSIDLFCH